MHGSVITEPSDACVGHFVAAPGLDAQPAEELDTCMACPTPGQAAHAWKLELDDRASWRASKAFAARVGDALVCADVVDARDLDF